MLSFIILTNDLVMVAEYFGYISLTIWILVFLLFILQVLIIVARHALFFPDIKYSTLLHIRLISVAYGFILPGQLATEGVRAYLLGKGGGGYSRSGTAIVMDKIMSLVGMLLLGIIGLFFSNTLGYGIMYVFLFSCILLILILFSLHFSFFYSAVIEVLNYLAKKAIWLNKLVKHGIILIDLWRDFSKNKQLMIKSFIYGLLFHLFGSVVGSLLSYGVGAEFNFFDWLWIHALSTFVLMIPISLGGLGIREGTLIGLLGMIAISPEQALAISFSFLALMLIQALTGVAIELVLIFKRKKESRR